MSAVYLDANATEILRPQARQAALEAMEQAGNPASVHFYGRAARRVLEESRKIIASAFARDNDACVFTSGGTEANILALYALGHKPGRQIMIGATEHDSVRRATSDADILPVTGQGLVDLSVLEQALRHNNGAGKESLVCIMAANNETGICAPLAEIAILCEQYGALLHIDAVQALGRIKLPLPALKKASFAISGHKMGGIKGAGALILPQDEPLDPLLPGGGQERGRRGGTPGLPALASMAAALTESWDQDWAGIRLLCEALEEEILRAGGEIVGRSTLRLPNTVCAVLPGIAAQIQLMKLDMAGFCVSAGSACSSGKVAASHVLDAMGLGEKAAQAIRISLPWCARKEDIQAFARAYKQLSA